MIENYANYILTTTILCGYFLVYLAPSIIIFFKRQPIHNQRLIYTANLLLGWTIIVWAVCLVAAVTSKPVVAGKNTRLREAVYKKRKLKRTLSSKRKRDTETSRILTSEERKKIEGLWGSPDRVLKSSGTKKVNK